MAKVTPAQSLLETLIKAQPVEPETTNRRRGKVDIPDEIRAQVKVMHDTGKVLTFDITDEDELATVKALYLDAAYEAGHSGHVIKVYDNIRDLENRKWIATRVSVGERMGRDTGGTNGSAPVTEDAESTTKGAQTPAFDRGW